MLKLFIIFQFLTLNTTHSGYQIEGETIIFTYEGIAQKSVYVSGNFNQWTKEDSAWKLQLDNTGKWKLTVPKSQVKKLSGGFYEFTFRVDGQLMDADKDNKDVMHCSGYGYRYIIQGL